MDESNAGNDKNIGIRFLYRAMVERDPSKRKVKPVEKNLQLLDFGDLGDSSDDSDFKIGEHEQGEDSDADDSGDTNKEESDDDDDEEESDKDEKKYNKSIIKKEPKIELQDIMSEGVDSKANIKTDEKLPILSVGELIDKAVQRQKDAKQRISVDGPDRRLKVLICCVCLGDISEENDEIVECDCCGITVHEGCYGISDTETAVSAASSSSTEPWFCDACKAGNMSPICELCPNPGGIFKETDVGRWVHLVCALYISGVAFGDVDKLSPVTLFEMPYSRWGAKPCSLCDDERFSRTGVCVCCDAGMCRSYFHVTCAQREGLLSEASTEEDIADPFFAYCKQHAEKGIIRSKRCNWLALQSQTKENRLASMPPSEEKSRIERKLAWHRERYNTNLAQKPPPWVPTQKMPRMLTSSATAYRRLMRKSDLLGLNSQTLFSSADALLDIRKKWHIPVAFSVEFVGYYLDRNNRMISMQKRLDELLQQNSKLQEEESSLRTQYEKLIAELEELQKYGNPMVESGTKFWSMLCDLSNKKLPLPDVLQKKPAPKSPSSKSSRRGDHSTSVISECGICHKTHDQHQMALCDKCHLHYHLACLDPPLSRMPKKTKSQGWQCSECDKTEEDDRADGVDPNAPRQLRDHSRDGNRRGRHSSPPSDSGTKISTSGRRGRPSRKLLESQSTMNTSSEVDDTCESQMEEDGDEKKEKITLTICRGKRKAAKEMSYYQRRGRKGKKRKLRETAAEEKEIKQEKEATPPPSLPPPTRSSRPMPPRRARDLRSNCCRCGETGDNANLVRCDECKKCYHFHCLRPPVKKSPKQRGYTWHCEDCDSSDEDGDTKKKPRTRSPQKTEVKSPKSEKISINSSPKFEKLDTNKSPKIDKLCITKNPKTDKSSTAKVRSPEKLKTNMATMDKAKSPTTESVKSPQDKRKSPERNKTSIEKVKSHAVIIKLESPRSEPST